MTSETLAGPDGDVFGQINDHNVPLPDFFGAILGGDVDGHTRYISPRTIDFVASHRLDRLKGPDPTAIRKNIRRCIEH